MKATEKLLDYVVKHTDQRFDEVNQRCDSIEDKLDQLLQFKWQIIGGSVVISVIFNLGLSILLR